MFGADTYLPFSLVEAALMGLCGLLFYSLARGSAGPWPSVAATLVLLFLGSATEFTATPYGIVILLRWRSGSAPSCAFCVPAGPAYALTLYSWSPPSPRRASASRSSSGLQ